MREEELANEVSNTQYYLFPLGSSLLSFHVCVRLEFNTFYST